MPWPERALHYALRVLPTVTTAESIRYDFVGTPGRGRFLVTLAPCALHCPNIPASSLMAATCSAAAPVVPQPGPVVAEPWTLDSGSRRARQLAWSCPRPKLIIRL